MKPTTIIFDFDGVVINSQTLWDEMQTELVEARGDIYDRDTLKPQLAGGSSKHCAQLFKEFYNWDEDVQKLSDERLERMSHKYKTVKEFMPGFKEFFDATKSTYKMGVGTSIEPRFLELVDKSLYVKELFNNEVYPTKDLGIKHKPAPDIFLYVAKQLESKPEECVVIEDALNGIEAAKAAGMIAIGLTTTFTSEVLEKSNPDFIAESFEEIKEYLDSL